MNIYVMRHGTTVWNEINKHQGRSNNRLSKSGKELVKQTALQNKNTKFDVIFTSPLFRTIQTTNIMNSFHHVKVVKDERLTEIDQGIFTGRFKDSLSPEELELKRKRDKFCKLENYQEVYMRAKDFLEEILKNCPYENILIVTHNVVATLLEYILTSTKVDFSSPESLSKFKNAQMKVFHV